MRSPGLKRPPKSPPFEHSPQQPSPQHPSSQQASSQHPSSQQYASQEPLLPKQSTRPPAVQTQPSRQIFGRGARCDWTTWHPLQHRSANQPVWAHPLAVMHSKAAHAKTLFISFPPQEFLRRPLAKPAIRAAGTCECESPRALPRVARRRTRRTGIGGPIVRIQQNSWWAWRSEHTLLQTVAAWLACSASSQQRLVGQTSPSTTF